MTTVVHPAPSKAQKWLVAFGLLIGAFILTAILGAVDGALAWAVPLGCAGAVIYAFINPQWTLLGFSASGIKKVFSVVGFITMLGAIGSSNEAVKQQQTATAQRIVDLGKTDPKAQATLLATADDGTLESLKVLAPALEASERSRRTAKATADKVAADAAAAEEAKQVEAANKDKIDTLVARERRLERDDLDGRIAAYQELTTLAPSRTTFKHTLTELQSERDRQAEVRVNPEKGLELVKFNWTKGGFGTVMLLDATVKNTSAVPLKDFTIKCVHSAPSGTEIDSNTETVFDVIAPGKTRRFQEISMGFIRSQASSSSCEITKARIA